MQQYVFIVIIAIVFLAMIIFAVIGKNYSLDKIKARKVGNRFYALTQRSILKHSVMKNVLYLLYFLKKTEQSM